MLVAIDPGVTMAGVAVFDSCSELAVATLERGKDWRATAYNIWHWIEISFPFVQDIELAVEIPQVYTQNKLRGDPNDLISLALVVGALGGLVLSGIPIRTYQPREWKGQVPKRVMIERIKEKLSEDERKRVQLPTGKSYHHNVWDSIGIGLHHLRKVRRGRQGAAAGGDLLRNR